MIPDVILEKGVWCDVNTLSGIPAGTDLLIISKSVNAVFVWVGTQPAEDSIDGIPLTDFNPSVTITGESDTVWAKVTGSVSGRLYVEGA